MTIKGRNDEEHRYVTAHVDTLGAIVRAVKPDGRLKMDRIGGFPWNMIEGENCTVHVASTGQKISGTILIHQHSCPCLQGCRNCRTHAGQYGSAFGRQK